ncbi:DUF5070 domain-containing protein [Chlamydia crocodili]|uniref:DUF5070 domain-containing protein n=1 Tax=Chlamydia crocodili TaxID=2766982 RepID=A0ABX8CD19_9CHLA|nr:DUF5070 domain-containing protein [Chlamydia crocodili]QVE48891.1 DUF5070 domain-containing protein [Chlamydia crocodili]
MRIVLHLEHLRHFQNQGSILFEDLVSADDCFALETKLRQFVESVSKNTLDARWRDNIFRTLPEVLALVKKRHLDIFAANLVHRPRLLLVSDFWVFPEDSVIEREEDCQLLLSLSGDKVGQGVFFVGPYPTELYFPEKGETALLLGFSSAGIPIS